MTDKKDIFYYAKFYGIPVYFQPEENEIRGRNLFWNVLLNILEPFIRIFPAEEGFPIEIENKTITREEIE